MSFQPRIAESGRPCCAQWDNGYGTGVPAAPTNPCAKCRAYFAAHNITLLEENKTMTDLSKYTPPLPYAIEIAEIRAARPEHFEVDDRFAAMRTAELAAEHAAFASFRAAQQPTPRTSDAELKKYEAPNPYAEGIRLLQEGRR